MPKSNLILSLDEKAADVVALGCLALRIFTAGNKELISTGIEELHSIVKSNPINTIPELREQAIKIAEVISEYWGK